MALAAVRNTKSSQKIIPEEEVNTEIHNLAYD